LSWERKKKDCGTGVLGFGNVVGVFWGVFGTHLEQAWNIVGTIYIDCQRVTSIRGTSVEHAWNLVGIWQGFGGVWGSKKNTIEGWCFGLCFFIIIFKYKLK